MTTAEKNLIELYRSQGIGCAEIASRINLSVNTVKSYCRRNKPVAATASTPSAAATPETGICKNCGAMMPATQGKRDKVFCSDKCRYQWWHLHRGNSLNATERACLFCGKLFRTNRPQKYCCHACYIKGRFQKQNEPVVSAV